ncbi:DUF3450 domain-containing protein [Vibrio sp. MEBiC08052]|uniref:DUF3450 domain-containing protein n=1 Tax=Vibrio sp. MEBiC08052 TaxID=1761910 RepID=UPI0007405CBA|nr:DUF3450 domain-containing protein [Vibrio sp. MEBiC08052]KUI99521.1 hypothetical protein VRK_16050 [Vibrio sp. MEBiC08052]
MNRFRYSAFALAALAAFPTFATKIDQAQSIQEKTNQASAHSQKVIDKSASESIELKASIERLREEVNNLQVYRHHLKTLIDSQNQEMTSLTQQINDIKETRQGIVPLMYHMIDGLKQIIAQDKPIKLEQRRARVEQLTALMGRADVSEAEKYRRILEAYQIEMDYGNKIATYQDDITTPDEVTREVDILYVGRLSLIARSLNHQSFWVWDMQSHQWLNGDTALLARINQAFDLANQQIAPTLLDVPVSLSVAEAK